MLCYLKILCTSSQSELSKVSGRGRQQAWTGMKNRPWIFQQTGPLPCARMHTCTRMRKHAHVCAHVRRSRTQFILYFRLYQNQNHLESFINGHTTKLVEFVFGTAPDAHIHCVSYGYRQYSCISLVVCSYSVRSSTFLSNLCNIYIVFGHFFLLFRSTWGPGPFWGSPDHMEGTFSVFFD